MLPPGHACKKYEQTALKPRVEAESFRYYAGKGIAEYAW
jgi:hypothetical protein